MALKVAPDHLARKGLPPTIEAVLFDIDGTLVDSVGMVAAGLADMYERYTGTRPSNSDVRALMGMPLKEQAKLFPGATPSPETIAEMTDYAIERYAHHEDLERPFEAALAGLHLVREAGIPVALVTSKNARELSDFRLRFPALDGVTVAITADDVARPKPSSEPTLLAASRLGVAPTACAFIGDSRFDLDSGREAGAFTVGVLYGSGTCAELASRTPDLLLGTPEELRDALAGLVAARGGA